MTKAVYAGTFDMPTLGHFEVIKKAVKAFGEVMVVIADNPAKIGKHMFSVDERMSMLHDMSLNIMQSKEYDSSWVIQVAALPKNTYLAKFAEENGAMFLVRGIRDQMDFKLENDFYRTNRRIAPYVETVYLMPDDAQSLISSSWVKSLIGYVGWVDQIKDSVTPYVLGEIKKWYLKKKFLESFREISPIMVKIVGESLWNEILSGYELKSYHNLDHLIKMLEGLDFFYPEIKECYYHMVFDHMVFAIFMHDINPSEDKSIEISNRYIDSDLVHTLIAATTHNGCEYATEMEEIIASLDLITLAGNYEQYSEYNKKIFNEYLVASGMSIEEFKPLWIQGRSEFINKFLARAFIFPHHTIRNYHANRWNNMTYEQQAKNNLALELEYLTAGNISHLE